MKDLPNNVKGGLHKNIFLKETWEILDHSKPLAHIREDRILQNLRENKNPQGMFGRKYRKNDTEKAFKMFKDFYKHNGKNEKTRHIFKLKDKKDKSRTLRMITRHKHVCRFLMRCYNLEENNDFNIDIHHDKTRQKQPHKDYHLIDLETFQEALELIKTIAEDLKTSYHPQFFELIATDRMREEELLKIQIRYSKKYRS